ncbi:MAG: response regulator [Nitrospira defluvii]|nr:response regulator [Nitrospira defluvii]
MPKILIADDSIAVRKVAERLLTEAGMGVTLAANGSEALALLSKDRPDLIVSDVIMPDKSGYEVCAFIRAQANLADIPVLLISGIVNDEVSRQAESCKADGVLKKPFQGTSLKDRVLDLLMKRQPKPASDPQPSPSPAYAEKSVIEEHPVAPIACTPEDAERTLVTNQECQQQNESAMISLPEPDLMSLSADSHEVVAPMADHPPVASSVLQEVNDRHAEVLAQRDARITALEEQLTCERQQSHEQIQQMQSALAEQRLQVADLSSRTGALDQALTEERAQRATLTEQLEDISRQAHRVDELETALAEARHGTEELLQQVSDNASNAARILELEAHLAAERGAATQLVQQITTLEHIEGRAHELETTLASEREETEACRKQSAAFETLAARVPALEEVLGQERARIAELDGLLATEREAAVLVMTQVKQLETAVQRAHELDLALADERERSMQLMKRATEAEHMAEQSNRRFEDMARKLGEIAGLASQLGNGKR